MGTNKKTIGEISRELGVSQRTIRYYEELGFVSPIRTESGYRTYSSDDIELLKIIMSFKELGMSLEDIHSIIVHGDEALNVSTMTRLCESLAAKKKEFENKITKYEEGIGQIDRILEIISRCTTCGVAKMTGTCEECLKKRKDVAPIIGSLFLHEPKIGRQ